MFFIDSNKISHEITMQCAHLFGDGWPCVMIQVQQANRTWLCLNINEKGWGCGLNSSGQDRTSYMHDTELSGTLKDQEFTRIVDRICLYATLGRCPVIWVSRIKYLVLKFQRKQWSWEWVSFFARLSSEAQSPRFYTSLYVVSINVRDWTLWQYRPEPERWEVNV
jgi:hypothetical protein